MKKVTTMLRALLSALVIAAFAFGPAHATEKIERAVTVTGEGTVTAVPDTALIRIGVTSQGKTALAASDANARETAAVIAAIKESGVADKDVQTSTLSLQPQYDQSKPGNARLTGFRVTHQLTITVRNIDQLSAVIDRAISVGANEMSGIEFVVSDQGKLLDRARTEAIADAHRKAELYAGAAGMKVGRVIAITEEGALPPQAKFLPMRAGAATPIARGEQTLHITVTVSYELTT
jgi:hypothetical protein